MKVILIITANDPDDRLQMLASEGKGIQFLLNSAARKNYEVSLLPETTTTDIIKELTISTREVEVLHYAGHANSSILRLNDLNAEAQALADKLKSLGTLKLVFINGCASRGQVEYFHQAGIPFVIATSRPVGDIKATWVANQFYQYLSLGRSTKDAFGEVVKDAALQQKSIAFTNKRRSIGLDLDENEDQFDWGLYSREDDENNDYRLPFSAKVVPNNEGVNHTVFLDKLIFALASINSPHLKEIKRLADNLRRGSMSNVKKISELLKVLPYTLGIRIRKISADPEDKDSEYYRQLLYDYVFLYETLLHQAASILIANLWQNYKTALQHKSTNLAQVVAFWCTDRLENDPFEYKSLVIQLFDWIKIAGISNPFSEEDTEGILAYLHSNDFEKSSAFFYQQKRFFLQRVRLNDDESLDNCFAAQQHLTTAFQALKRLAAYSMASVRGINVVNFRHLPTEYGNIVSKLVVTEAEPTSVFDNKMLENKSILCYTAEDSSLEGLINESDTLSLFPFVIDRNVFTEKANSEVDLYLFTGYFPDFNGKLKYHFASVQNPAKIWQFDENEDHFSLLHIGETATAAHQANHLMANGGEFRSYLSEFKHKFLKY